MRRKRFRLALPLLLPLFLLPVYAAAVLFQPWEPPSSAQLQQAAEGRMPLPLGAAARHVPRRYYVNVQLTHCAVNSRYQPIGQARYENTSDTPVVLAYSQAQAAATAWDVTDNLLHNEALCALVCAKIRESLPLSFCSSVTTPRSQTPNADLTVPPGKTGSICAYHSAIETQGSVTWVEMDDEGVIRGAGKSPFGGAFILEGIYLENEIS